MLCTYGIVGIVGIKLKSEVDFIYIFLIVLNNHVLSVDL